MRTKPLIRLLLSFHTNQTLTTTTIHRRHVMTSSTTTTVSPSTTTIGWIGTGVMGQSMCSHLLKAGYKLTIFTRTQSKAQNLLNSGAHWASSPAQVASQSDIVFTIVGYPSDVRHVILDKVNGVLTGMKVNGVVVDMTTSEPSLAVEIARVASERGVHALDAPVSGGDKGAREGTLSIFCGGDEGVVKELTPVLTLLGKVNYMGGPGKGQFCKLANQVTIASTMVGLIEGLIYASKSGLNLGDYLNAISSGAAGSKSLELYGQRILKRDFEAGFYVNHFVKDLGICLKECEKMGIGLPGLALAQQLYVSLKAHGEGDLGTQALVLALERMNNTSLESSRQ
ncbi:6-phosphogluconate dehydrogenase, C-terminal-like protein [Artemisia annua]|uniref:6-phosphogluconate dehydrogenase, C-terminal-like protein n=1 Tax=Artemisia annua TaxID=35608 RepID=A0A2U1KBG2_ARTAN|nr:6-phosphogluconate dehydrogenase, C-terminal-like protein [Artemisia annua]